MNRAIWSLWLQGEHNAPILQQACLKSWRRFNPDWEFVCLDERSASRYLDLDLERLRRLGATPQALSDIVRIELLNRYGGVWVDASCLCRKPLSAWLHEVSANGFFAFSNPGPDRLVSTWFLYAEQGHPIIRHWAGVVSGFWRTSPGRPLDLEDSPPLLAFLLERYPWLWGVRAVRWIERAYPYFWFHYLFEWVVRRYPEVRNSHASMPKVSSDIPHRAQMMGLGQLPTPEQKTELGECSAPLYKLDSRLPFDAAPAGSILHVLLADGLED
ncbi:MAG: hypothetical protein KDJ90_03985 [Nitratireductor sp.]|nr:hypothetical protein [Nitratireductor sp.]